MAAASRARRNAEGRGRRGHGGSVHDGRSAYRGGLALWRTRAGRALAGNQREGRSV